MRLEPAGRTRPAAVIGYVAVGVYLLTVAASSLSGSEGITGALIVMVGLLPLSMVLALVLIVRLVRRRRTLAFGRRERRAMLVGLGVVLAVALAGFLVGMLS
ncbi:hypothetical protein COUCH_11500 [Couchioplanes caeruleus]|uniref:hypothetical protein n=1 Tax=Couchioplanes caeruleus TaxID=56438 RepID=UPI0020C07826|nr:hypothetical protein [Couchioplanes caeruleus]UQU66847.1 hypothetical protein COUCH_11500 [Couchioplanes caeruleus]